MKRMILLVAVLALGMQSAPAVEPTQSCGGLAPVIPSCTFSGRLALQNSLTVEGGLFVGEIAVTIATFRGRYNARCTIVPFLEPTCTESQSGVLVPGDEFSLLARVGLATPIQELRGVSAGRWRVIFGESSV